MSRSIHFLISILILSLSLSAEAARKKKERLPYEDPEEPPVSLSYTHILPSAFVIPSGNVVVGTDLGVGIMDVFDLSTNLYLDFAQVFNISAKASLWKSEEVALAVYATYASQSAKTYDSNGLPITTTYSSFSPGGTLSYYIEDDLTGHTGLTFTARSPAIDKSTLVGKSGFLHGTYASQEFTYGIRQNLAVSVGFNYDLTYDYWGAGASLHLSAFQVGAHYYFNVSEGSLIPILGIGYSTSL